MVDQPSGAGSEDDEEGGVGHLTALESHSFVKSERKIKCEIIK